MKARKGASQSNLDPLRACCGLSAASEADLLSVEEVWKEFDSGSSVKLEEPVSSLAAESEG